MQDFIVNAIAALTGALAAGVIGYFFAVRRFHHERVFERRLAWYEKSVCQLTEAGEALRKVAVSMQVPELHEDLQRDFKNALAAVPDARLLMEAGMYASPKSYQALKEAQRDQSELVTDLLQVQRAGASFGQPEMAERISPRIVMAAAKSMLHAASRLSSDVRQTLRLRDLNDVKRLYDDDSLAALGGRPDLTALERAKRIDGYKDLP